MLGGGGKILKCAGDVCTIVGREHVVHGRRCLVEPRQQGLGVREQDRCRGLELAADAVDACLQRLDQRADTFATQGRHFTREFVHRGEQVTAALGPQLGAGLEDFPGLAFTDGNRDIGEQAGRGELGNRIGRDRPVAADGEIDAITGLVLAPLGGDSGHLADAEAFVEHGSAVGQASDIVVTRQIRRLADTGAGDAKQGGKQQAQRHQHDGADQGVVHGVSFHRLHYAEVRGV